MPAAGSVSSLAGARVLVTGGAGFLGSRLVPLLLARGAVVTAPRSRDYDLVRGDDVRRLLADTSPGVVFHLAGRIGGIAANSDAPGRFLYENAMMGLQLLEECRVAGVRKFVGVGTVCEYPCDTPVPFHEDALWDGYPEPTNAPYGLAKKLLLVQGQAYRRQYGFPAIHLLPANLYGPGDNLDPHSSHVIPALARKCLAAVRDGRDEVEVWGTGTATREFLYVDDAAEALVLAAERYDGAEPVNLGTGRETPIREVASMVATAAGFHGRFRWDPTRPDGQPRRCLDVSRAESAFGFRATTPLEDGIARTVAWVREEEQRQAAVVASR